MPRQTHNGMYSASTAKKCTQPLVSNTLLLSAWNAGEDLGEKAILKPRIARTLGIALGGQSLKSPSSALRTVRRGLGLHVPYLANAFMAATVDVGPGAVGPSPPRAFLLGRYKCCTLAQSLFDRPEVVYVPWCNEAGRAGIGPPQRGNHCVDVHVVPVLPERCGNHSVVIDPAGLHRSDGDPGRLLLSTPLPLGRSRCMRECWVQG